jgi:hypothetical protein
VKRLRTIGLFLFSIAVLAASATASFPWDTHLMPH